MKRRDSAVQEVDCWEIVKGGLVGVVPVSSHAGSFAAVPEGSGMWEHEHSMAGTDQGVVVGTVGTGNCKGELEALCMEHTRVEQVVWPTARGVGGPPLHLEWQAELEVVPERVGRETQQDKVRLHCWGVLA
jgi:hypothetical protein